MRVTRYITSYNFPRPSQMTEAEYMAARQALPVKAHIDVFGEMSKKYGVALAVRCVFFWIPSGTLTSAYNYYSMLKDKKRFYDGLYEAIYSTTDYSEYCRRYQQLSK